MQTVRTVWPVLLLAVGLIGLTDATYLAVKKLSGAVVPCLTTSGCDIVTNSSYATIGPVPISLLGALYYLAIVVVAVYVLDIKSPVWLGRLANLTWIGFLFSLYLLAIMAFALKAYCFYCLVSAGTSITLWVIGRLAKRTLRHSFDTPFPPPTGDS
jgi:uncharacterized membrane protein